MLENQKIVAATVVGPLGEPLSLETLPPSTTKRWVVRRKAEVIFAVNGGLLTLNQACDRYSISPEEFSSWQRAVERSGMPGLRVTRLKQYRDQHAREERYRSELVANIPAYGAKREVAISPICDSTYYAARAEAERELERQSPQRVIAAIHAQLASRYEQLASSGGEKVDQLRC